MVESASHVAPDDGTDRLARRVAFRLRLLVLQQDAPFMTAEGICGETRRIEDLFIIALRHALCDHPPQVHLWGAGTPN